MASHPDGYESRLPGPRARSADVVSPGATLTWAILPVDPASSNSGPHRSRGRPPASRALGSGVPKSSEGAGAPQEGTGGTNAPLDPAGNGDVRARCRRHVADERVDLEEKVVHDLDTTVSAVQSAIALEALMSAAFILIDSKIGDLIGRKAGVRAGPPRPTRRRPRDGRRPGRPRSIVASGRSSAASVRRCCSRRCSR